MNRSIHSMGAQRLAGRALLACAPLLLLAQPAAAQIEEVIVTAQKREQSLQDVPAAISAFTSERLREQGFSSLLDVQGHTPGLQISNFSVAQPEISIRGITTKEDGVGANDSTVVSVDDVYIAARSAQIFDIFDLERIEVLRGPQGTLYGRNSIGGSINLVTMKPNADFLARIEQTFARFDRYDTRGLINGAIADNLFGKLSFSRRIADGYTKSLVPGVDDAHDQDSIYVRGQALWQVSERTEALFTFDFGRDDNGPTNREPVGSSGIRALGDVRDPVAVNRAFGGTDAFDSLSEFEGFLERDVYGVSAKITHELSWPVTVTSITAIRRSELDWWEDSSSLPPAAPPFPNGQPPTVGFQGQVNDIAQENATQFTQELRLSSRDFDRMTWVTGLFFTYERMNRTETFDFRSIEATQASIQKNDTLAWAIYGQGTYDITDRLRFTAGGRFSFETKTYRAAGQVINPGVIPPFAAGVIVGNFTAVEEDETWTSFDSRFALDFDLTDDIMLYASVAEGFKSGGFTGSPATPEIAVVPFEPEEATNYEVGVKARMFEQRLQANLTGFWTDYEDLQVTTFASLAPPNDRPFGFGQFITENAATAEIKGIELELVASPFDGLELGASASWLDAQFTDFSPVFERAGDVDFTGNRLRQSPEWTASVYGRYIWQIGNGSTLALRVDGRYQDMLFYDPENDDFTTPGGGRNQSKIGDYQIWDSRLAYTSPGGMLEVAVWARNMFDEEYETHVFTQSGGGVAFALFGAPRTYGVTVTLNYD